MLYSDGMHTDDLRLILAEALYFAIEAHSRNQQTREDLSTAYHIHLLRVIERLRLVGKINDPIILSAAALHDVIEDCEVSAEQLEAIFGKEIAHIVVELSIGPEQSEEDYFKQISQSSTFCKTIKLADKWDNVNELKLKRYEKYGNHLPAVYINKAEAVLKACDQVNIPLYRALEAEIAVARALIDPATNTWKSK